MPIIIAGLTILPLVISYFLPRYISSIFIMQALILRYGLQNLTFSPSSFLVSNNHQKKLIPITIGSLLLAIISNYIIISLGFRINGVAFVTTIVFLINAIMISCSCFKTIDTNSFIKPTINILWRRIIFVLSAFFILTNNYNIFYVIVIYVPLYSDITVQSIKVLQNYNKSQLA
jgi:O-antigen/teichoic acid export membrane protein